MNGEDRLGFVSVVFEPEIPLQVLQARSFARHLDPAALSTIVVVDNTVAGMSRSAARRLREAYGHLQSHVDIVRMKALADMPGRHGWVRQQVAKLLASARFSTPYYVALDAKNHLIRRTGLADFLTADGLARSGRHSYREHPLRDRLAGTLAYLDASPALIERSLDRFATTTTPFVFSTSLVTEILSSWPRQSAFAEEFQREGLLEFFLYSGWIEVRGGGYESIYRDEPIQCPTIWPKRADSSGARATIATAENIDAPFFAVHRRSLARADSVTRAELAEFWVRRGLFASVHDAEAFTRGFQRGYRRRMAFARGAERAAGMIRRRGGAMSAEGEMRG